MTRINTNDHDTMSDQLQVNAMGEEPRVLDKVIYRIDNDMEFNDIPESFRLGPGHVKFFFDKVGYIVRRYLERRMDYYNRKGKEYSLEHLDMVWERYLYIHSKRPDLCNDWSPTSNDKIMSKRRILDRSKTYTTKHTYHGKPVVSWSSLLKLNS